MKTLKVEKRVLKEVEWLPSKQYRQLVGAILDLITDPLPHYSKPLQGSPYLEFPTKSGQCNGGKERVVELD